MAQLQSQTQAVSSPDTAEAPTDLAVLLLTTRGEQARLGRAVPPAYHLLTADDLTEALTLWRTGTITWVLLDLTWPGGSGLDFLTTIGAGSPQRPLPVTVLVAPGQERMALEAMKRGAADYWFKSELTPGQLWASLPLTPSRPAPSPPPNALEQAHQHYQNLVENSPDIVERFDCQLRHLYVSPRLSQLTGLETEAFLGKTCRELGMDEAMVNDWERAAATLLAKGEKQVIEFSTPTLIGLRHFEMVLAPEWSDAGQIESILCISRDISDRKAAETTRLQSEALRHDLGLLEHTLESILAGYWDIDFAAQTAYMSPGLKRMFGYADHELPNRPDTWQTLIFPADLPIALSSLEAHIQSRGALPYYNEVRYRHRDGSTVWVLCAGRVIAWDDAGQPLHMAGCHVDITALKHTEAKLKQSQTHLETAQRIGNLGSWELDLQTQDITWSAQVYRIFGHDPASGPPSLEALVQQIHPDDVDHYQYTVDQAITVGQPYDLEFRILHPDGGLRTIQAKGERVVGSDGQPTHLMGTVQDISDRKQAETQLQSLSLRLRLALESASIGIWERIMSSDEVIWDQCLVDLYGFGDLDHSATYQEWRDRVHVDDIQRVEAGHQALLDNDTSYDLDFRIWRGDGTLGWIRSSALVRRDAQGQPLSVIGINYDITEAKLAATALQDLSLRLDLALESGGLGTWKIDFLTQQIDWDQRMYNIYGLSHLGRAVTFDDWRNSVYREDVDQIDRIFSHVIQGGAPPVIEFRIDRGDGELRWIRATATAQYDPSGRPLGMIGTNADITEAKRAEAQLLRTTAQLKTSNRELEAFAYSVSHDLRAPLRAIDGFSRALVEDFGDQFGDEGRDYFDRIRHNVSRMGQLIDDLLRLSRVSRSTMVYAPVDLSTLVQEQIDDLSAADPDRVVTVAITPDITVSADPTLMRVAIANLVQNAWKFTAHHPTATLEFGVTIERDEPTYYLRDDGAGFDMTYTNKLFGVFQRLHNTDEFPGTGIGLATVQRAIHRHGGRVWAEAAVEQGATFYFTLPSAQPALEVQP